VTGVSLCKRVSLLKGSSSNHLRAYLKIDVTKFKLNKVFFLENRHVHCIFANTEEGFAALHTWIQEQRTFDLSVYLKSIGNYSDAIAFCSHRTSMDACLIRLCWSVLIRPKACGVKRTRSMHTRQFSTGKTNNHLMLTRKHCYVPIKRLLSLGLSSSSCCAGKSKSPFMRYALTSTSRRRGSSRS